MSTDRATACLGGIKTGQVLSLGSYPQSDAAGAAKEPIEWKVLDVQDGKALLVSVCALDCLQYHADNTSVTWEGSDIRKWLNGDFLAQAFDQDEQAQILTVQLSNPDSTVHGAAGGADTEDKVFLLGIDDAERYFASDEDRTCKATAFAAAKGLFLHPSNGNCWWWLRTPGYYTSDAAGVNYNGYVHKSGDNVSATNDAVRPAVWVKAE